MPYVANRGQYIHYTVEGSGPLIVLLHGLFSNADSWKRTGVVDALSDRFRVACVDSLGHGLSDKPPESRLYAQDQRAADVVAVIDDLGCDQAHLVGYSMGGWTAVGVAKYCPGRLASLTVGGWDLVKGVESALPSGSTGTMAFEQLITLVRSIEPAMVEWVTPEVEPGLRACLEALAGQLAGAEEAVLGVAVPVMLWNGRDDPFHDPMQAFAAVHGLRFLSTAGDHGGAVLARAAEGANGLRAFLETV